MSEAPLAGKRILITRPAHQAQELIDLVRARRMEPILASTIEIVPPDDVHAAHHAIDDLHAYRWAVFTSQNGVDVFFDRLHSLDADARYLAGLKVAAIGTKTAQRLRENGIRADLVPSANVSEAIARALIEATKTNERILIFRAQEGRDVLPEMLADAGRIPHVVAAYKTIFHSDPEFTQKVERADILTFTSASTVRGFIELAGNTSTALALARDKTVACIGPITADAAVDAGIHVDVVADVSSTESLLDALERYLTAHPA
jgi:uroporphyrinogen III methyltransferase / synthase